MREGAIPAALAALLALVAAKALAQTEAPPPAPAAVAPAASYPAAAERVVAYEIAVTLDPGEKTITGRESVTWRNTTESDSVGDLFFHLYFNAFKNEASTAFRESGGRGRRGESIRPGEWGYVDLLSMKTAGGADLLATLEYRHPDDDNADDRTVARVALPEPVRPGQSVTVEIEFRARFPHAFRRAGYHDDFFMATQWFPKLGVYEGARGGMPGGNGWNCRQYHASGEFFSDFGTYEVAITAPAAYKGKIGATGVLKSSVEGPGGTVTETFAAEDVHDFAWVADPDFVVESRPFEARGDRGLSTEAAQDLSIEVGRLKSAFGFASEAEFGLKDVEVRLLVQPEHARHAGRHFEAAFNALRYFGLWFGPYPYPTLTLVDPAYNAGAAGGMEYPTLITLGTSIFSPRATHSPEGVLSHEFGHQYWYGLVANDELEEAWLDEGFTSYTESLAREKLDTAYPHPIASKRYAGLPVFATPLLELPSELPRSDVRSAFFLSAAGVPLGNPLLDYLRDLPFLNFVDGMPNPARDTRRARYLTALSVDPMKRNSWEYLDGASYRVNAYDKPFLFLATLDGILGRDAFLRVLRTYQQRFRFRHPTSADFLAVLNEASGRDMTALFEQVVNGSSRLDYAVTEVASTKVGQVNGVFDGPEGRVIVGPKPGEEPKPSDARLEEPVGAVYRSEVVVRRLGEVVVPVEIEIKFEREPATLVEWDGADRWKRFRFEKPARLEWARVDPGGKIALDANPSNNGLRREPDPRAAAQWSLRFLQWLQNVLHHYTRYS